MTYYSDKLATLRFLPENMRLGRQLRVYCDARFKTIGLTLARGQVLLHLQAAAGSLPQSELTALLAVEHPTAIRLFDRLQALGYITRSQGENDRRVNHVVLTETGTALAHQASEINNDIILQVMAGISMQDIDHARQVIALISNNLDNL